MSEIIRRYFIRKKERSRIINMISKDLRIDFEDFFDEKIQIEVIIISKYRLYLFDKEPYVAESERGLFPTLHFKKKLVVLPNVVVDMGAVSHICNGADIMAPGVIEIQGVFVNDDFVVVSDEKNRKPLSVARSLFDSQRTRTVENGKLFTNIHYVGDNVWNTIRNL